VNSSLDVAGTRLAAKPAAAWRSTAQHIFRWRRRKGELGPRGPPWLNRFTAP